MGHTRHTAATPTTFGTVMSYVALRILGMERDDPIMTEIRGLIHEMGEWSLTSLTGLLLNLVT